MTVGFFLLAEKKSNVQKSGNNKSGNKIYNKETLQRLLSHKKWFVSKFLMHYNTETCYPCVTQVLVQCKITF